MGYALYMLSQTLSSYHYILEFADHVLLQCGILECVYQTFTSCFGVVLAFQPACLHYVLGSVQHQHLHGVVIISLVVHTGP